MKDKDKDESKELQIFENPEFGEVRTVVIDDEPWFVGKDVAAALGYENPQKALRDHVDNEDKKMGERNVTPSIKDSLGREQYPVFINESGLYSLVLSSKLPTAKKFKRWVTSEILPAIRKHGGYMTPEKVEEALLNPDVLIQLATELKEERNKNKALHDLAVEQDKHIARQNDKIAVLTPKGIFADAVSVSKTDILIGDLAKLIKQNGHDIGQKRLFAWLREKGYLIKRKGLDWNMPTQRAMEMKLFRVKETVVTHADGHTTVSKTTKVTGKGQVYFVNKFLGVR